MKVIGNKSDARLLELNSGERIKLLADGDLTVKVLSVTHKIEVGSFDFNYIDHGNGGLYKLTHMFLDDAPGYVGQGIGRECLKFCIDQTSLPIYCGKAEGSTADDGSHLTGNGEGFAKKMIEEGIISGQI
ncbi:hypothetical protein P3498_14425 [Vibrio parahaemolyticus]|uniref:hypothetical protein n=1 Tax=Vibrio parahaemolyticus TaxID=670 RepID=UPI001123F329|nr:hypothetical protein [Vibrio parahaemolyticus]MDF4617008.1 hypothetical protein [Vibrio parahaemolyticus]MDF5004374.1 hypothetical protein [Vibrio parahaemolyticus]TOB37448.1 hypothetical protein CGK06_24815 [Vibrio parahaemolyticus]TOB98428.1 hypothetical protein CGJ94_25695 [Vibrio parahaemolyticus]HCG5249876.1 hypothetical protein [Vibrio parahaemolyticus]